MSNSIVVSYFPHWEGTKKWQVVPSEANAMEEAQALADSMGENEKIVACIKLEWADPGVRAFAAVLDLSMEMPTDAPDAMPPIVDALSKIFFAGLAFGLKEGAGQ